jgi:hypothetical protein
MRTIEELKAEIDAHEIGEMFDDQHVRPIHEIARDVFHLYKASEQMWNAIKEEAFDNIDDRYSKEEAAQEGINFSFQSRFDEKSFENDSEYMMLKSELKNRKELLKQAHKCSEKGIEFVTSDGEVIKSVASKKGVKILTFKY